MGDGAEAVYQSPRFTVFKRSFREPGGVAYERQWIRHPGAVTVLPLFHDGRVLLIRQHRQAVDQTLVELPAGTLERAEPPEQTAARELKEETGYEAESIEKLREFYMSPGILTERMHVFVARGIRAGESAREPGEKIDNLIVSWDEAMAMASDGRIEDAKTLTTLLLYDRFKSQRSPASAKDRTEIS